MPAKRIAEFLADPTSDSFDEIALAALAEAYETEATVREICDRCGVRPGEIGDWRSIPTVPAARATDREAPPAQGLAELAAATAFRGSCLHGLAAPPFLDLVGDEPTAALSARFGGPGSIAAASSGRTDVNAARSWLAGRQRDGRAAVIVATQASMRRLLTTLERQDLRFRIGFGSRVILMGNSTATEETPVETLSVERLALEAEAVYRRYRRQGVATACYGRAQSDGSLLISAPHWMRFATVDPMGGAELEEGAQGRLVVLDLTAAARPFRVETADLGTVEKTNVRLTGVSPPEGTPPESTPPEREP